MLSGKPRRSEWGASHDSAGCSTILYRTKERLIDYDIAVPGRCVVPMKPTTINLTSCFHEYASARDWRAETSRTGNVIASERPFLGKIRR